MRFREDLQSQKFSGIHNYEKGYRLTLKSLIVRLKVFPIALLTLSCISVPLSLPAESNQERPSFDGETDSSSVASIQSEQIVSDLQQLQAQIKGKATPLTLDASIAIGLQNNPELSKAYSIIQQFEWKLIAAKRQWYPTLNLQNGDPFVGQSWSTYISDNYAASAQRLRSLDQQRKQGDKTQQLLVQPGAIASWNMIDPTRQPDINSAFNALKQQKYLFDVSARNLILNIEESYFSIQSTLQLIESFQEIYAINKKQLEILEARKAIGMVNVLELEQTRSQLFSELNRLIFYTRNYIQQAAELAELLALPRDQLAIPADPAALHGKWELSLDATISRALEKREEILSRLAAAEAAEWSAVAAIRSYLPIFSLVASGSLDGWNGYESVPVSFDPGPYYERNRQWTAAVGIGFTWSIFDGGVQAANSEASKALAREQQAQAAATEFQVVKQVRSSYGQMQTALVAVQSAKQAYKSAQFAQVASRARFEAGVGDITSVVQTIQQLSLAAQQRSQALLGYNNAVAQLYRYSATLPAETKQDLDQRMKLMRSNPKPATPSADGVEP